jgi:CheY-like chemotaxis protein
MGCDIPRRYLEKEGFRVECAADGIEGINKINDSHPDIILLDVMLPGMSGWQVLTYVKKQPALVHIPVIMLTMIDEKSTAYSLGATYYLSKPIDKDELSNVVNKCVRKEGLDSVLIVDDNADARKLVRLILENEGMSVVEAENGYLGLMRVAERRPALIMLDLMMPGMNGAEFLDELDKREDWRDIPVIALTAVDMDDDSIRMIENRVERVIQKGAYSIDFVLNKVREIMQSQEA